MEKLQPTCIEINDAVSGKLETSQSSCSEINKTDTGKLETLHNI